MLVRLLKNNRAGGFVFIIILMTLIWLKSFIAPLEDHDRIAGMPLYNLLFGPLEERKILASIISMLFYGLLLAMVYRLNIIHFLLEERSIMPSVFFLLISATYPPALIINPILVSSLFLFLAILTLIRGEEHRAEPLSLFNAALFLAAGSLFYFKILYFIPFLWVTASIIRPIQWRGIVNPILVIIMVGMFYITYFWVFKSDLSLFADLLQSNNLLKGNFSNFDLSVWILLAFLLFLLFISNVRVISRYQIRKIIVRKLYQVFLFMFLYTIIIYLFFTGYRAEIIPILALPLAFLFSTVFNKRKEHWTRELLLWIWFGLIAYVIISV